MSYFIRGKKRRNFSLEENDEIVFKANFPSWAKTEVNIHFAQVNYTIKKKNWFKSSYIIIRNRVPIGEVTTNWRRHFFFKLKADYAKEADYVPSNMDIDATEVDWGGKELVTYTLKHKGIFKTRLEAFQNKDPRPILIMHTEKNWFKVNYRIECPYGDSFHYPIEELLGLFGFGAVMIRARRRAAAAS